MKPKLRDILKIGSDPEKKLQLLQRLDNYYLYMKQ